MARVTVTLSQVWFCPHCDVVLKARRARTTVESAERHLVNKHNVLPQNWDIRVEPLHWAFNLPPADKSLWTRAYGS